MKMIMDGAKYRAALEKINLRGCERLVDDSGSVVKVVVLQSEGCGCGSSPHVRKNLLSHRTTALNLFTTDQGF